MSGPRPACRNMAGKMSPSDAEFSSRIVTSEPWNDGAARVDGRVVVVAREAGGQHLARSRSMSMDETLPPPLARTSMTRPSLRICG
jgi:hypothetical protein